jgi:hypothetical protein
MPQKRMLPAFESTQLVLCLEPEAANDGCSALTQPYRPHHSVALAEIQAEYGCRAGEEQSTHGVGLCGARVDRRPALRADDSAEDGLSTGLGTRDARMGVSAERGRPALFIVRSCDTPPESRLTRDFRISDAHRVGEGSLREKANANLAAIRTLKQVEAEQRPATEEEKALLIRYSGWGAMPQAFSDHFYSAWNEIGDELKALLTEEEYNSARASLPNAHYTAPLVIRAIWRALERMGVSSGVHILEPSIGIGHFFGLMPESLYSGTRRTGIELDSVSTRIARLLYPDSTIHAKAFEETTLPDNFFNVVIGNVPFGDYAVYDPSYRKRKPFLTRAIHDYFFSKSLDKVRPGGLLALITSHHTMDKQDSSMRVYLAARANLLAAIRLPNTAFKANAGTSVTTDIIFLQKLSDEIQPNSEAWQDICPIQSATEPIFINEYFVNHPEMLLGEMALDHGLYGVEPSLRGTLSAEALSAAVSTLPIGIYQQQQQRPPLKRLHVSEIPDAKSIKDGAFAEVDGKLVIRNGESFEPAQVSASVAERIRGMMRVRDAVREVFRSQLQDAADEQIRAARQQLNQVYDSFVSRYGALSSKDNLRAFAGDPDQPLLLSLEDYDPDTRRATKTPVFERRTLERYQSVEHVETASAALVVSLNETGEIDWPRMQQLTGKPATELQAELDILVYCNPEQQRWEAADRYLSGNVRAKLAAAEAAAAIDPAYTRNVEALRAVQPKDLEPGEIEARLGSPWIPVSDIRDFIGNLLAVPISTVSVCHSDAIATWTLELDWGAKQTVNNTSVYGTAILQPIN